MPLYVGAATRIAEYHAADPKRYHATIVFGARSTTDDLEGELSPVEGVPPDRGAVEEALGSFRGEIVQRPPAFSAVKVAGRRAYRAAREGTPLEIPDRRVEIARLDIVAWEDSDPARPAAEVEIDCSAGTYVRSLARDLGELLGSGAYLAALVRTASGPFRLAEALALDEVRRLAAEQRLASALLPLDTGLERFPSVVLEDAEVRAVAQGQIVRPNRPLPEVADMRVRLFDEAGRLVAIAEVSAGRLHPEKVFLGQA